MSDRSVTVSPGAVPMIEVAWADTSSSNSSVLPWESASQNRSHVSLSASLVSTTASSSVR